MTRARGTSEEMIDCWEGVVSGLSASQLGFVVAGQRELSWWWLWDRSGGVRCAGPRCSRDAITLWSAVEPKLSGRRHRNGQKVTICHLQRSRMSPNNQAPLWRALSGSYAPQVPGVSWGLVSSAPLPGLESRTLQT